MDTETRLSRLEQGQLALQDAMQRMEATQRHIGETQRRIGVVLEETLRLLDRIDSRMLAVEQQNGHEG